MIDERGFMLAEEEKEKALLAKTFTGESEALVVTIRIFLVAVLKDLRKRCLKFYKILDAIIEDLKRDIK